MYESYDEDLLENQFYKSLITKGKSLYDTAANNRWTICIPRKGTTSSLNHTKQCFESHILKRENDDSDLFTTLNNKDVRIKGSFIVTVKGFPLVKSIQVLFEETFFNGENKSYHVLCIDQSLEGENFMALSSPVIQKLETLQNCVEFLWPKTLGARKSTHEAKKLLDIFNSTYTKLESETIRHIMDASNAVFTGVMQICLRDSHLRRPAIHNKSFMDNVKVAVETFVMDGLYKRVFKGISSLLANENAAFNKTTRNLADLQVKDLGVSSALWKNIPRSKKILSNITKFTTPLEKLYVLKFTITMLSSSTVKSSLDENDLVTADDLLPALVFLVVKSDIPNWFANLSYMKNFHFSQSKNDEFQFYLSSIEAAVEYVRSGQLDNVVSMTQTQRLKVVCNMFQQMGTNDKQTGPSPVDEFFEHVRAGRLGEVVKLFKDSITTMKEITDSMCHPLCSCDTCEKMLSIKRKDPTDVTVFSRDDLGCTALHHAAEFGRVEIMYELIKKGAVVNATNYHGSTPLHYACRRGHHKSAVILTHYKADVNASDSAENTPLHLAVSHGHEVCTDYLCSIECEDNSGRKLKVDAMNEHNDTPLHIASRWGFGDLVYILLRNGADATILNKETKSALQCALNVKIQEIFLELSNEDPEKDGYVYPQAMTNTQVSPQVSPKKSYSISSTSFTKQKKEFCRLLKAIADGDLNMVRHKLGLNVDKQAIVEDPDKGLLEEKLCHPLCQCTKCMVLQKTMVNQNVVINANMANSEGVRPLHVASIHGFEQIVKLLLKEAAAEPNVKTQTNRRTPLHLACQYNNIECVGMLLKKGARPNIKDINGNTPLHFCCTNGHVGPAILLLQKGASVDITNHRGNTPLHDACRWNFVDLVRLLLYYDASTEVQNKASMLPQHYARDEAVSNLLNEAAVNEVCEVSDVNFRNRVYIEESDFIEDQKLFNSMGNKVVAVSSAQDSSKLSFDLLNDSSKDLTAFPEYHINSSEIMHRYETKKNERQTNKDDRQPTKIDRRSTLNAIFGALETRDVNNLIQISYEVKHFNRKKSLKRVSTIDKSSPRLFTEQTLSDQDTSCSTDQDSVKVTNAGGVDWLDDDINADSAEEAIEDAPTIFVDEVDVSSPQYDCRVRELLSDAIHEPRERVEYSAVREFLREDDNLFARQ